MRAHPVIAAVPMASSLLWAGLLGWSLDAWSPGSALLAGASLVVMATVATVGMLVARGEWAKRLGLVVVGEQLLVSLSLPVGPWWAAGLVASSATLAALTGPWVEGLVRKGPAAAGPPATAVLLPLALLGVPFVLAMAGMGGPTFGQWLMALASPLLALGYARALPAAMWSVRLGYPLLALVAMVGSGPPGWVVAAIVGSVVTLLAWRSEVRLAVEPLVPERRGALSIPPELAPREVLDAAGIDERGRRR
ncbi:MAG: hypothetical protein ACRDVM_08925 [Acidimicrobiia bacterium]